MAVKEFTCTVPTKAVSDMRIAMIRVGDRLDEISVMARATGALVSEDALNDDQLYTIFGLFRRCADEARAEMGKFDALSLKLRLDDSEAVNG